MGKVCCCHVVVLLLVWMRFCACGKDKGAGGKILPVLSPCALPNIEDWYALDVGTLRESCGAASLDTSGGATVLAHGLRGFCHGLATSQQVRVAAGLRVWVHRVSPGPLYLR